MRLTADPTLNDANWNPNAMFNAVPENQDEENVLHATSKFSEPSPKANLPRYTTALISMKHPNVVNAWPERKKDCDGI